MRKTKLILIVLMLGCAAPAWAQFKRPVPTRNAALRYWLAFADVQDSQADRGTSDLLEKTAAGEAAWDEAKLGAILDKNDAAIQGMQRATKLPECDWGVEYELGPAASIAYAPRARVLARLNTLYGMRLAAKGNTQKAVDTWLAGIRFSQHLAQGGSLIFSLIAKTTLLSDFHSLTQAAQSGSLTEAQRKQIVSAVRAVPETGFDWGQALWYEQDSLDLAVKRASEAADPSAYYRELVGERAPGNFTIPKASEVAAFHKTIGAAEMELRTPPAQAQDKLGALQDSVKSLHPLYQALTPSFTRVNESRIQIQAAREKLLQALSSKE
jgi:hypothetical protein